MTHNITSVPAILKYLSDCNQYGNGMETPVRAKKRRLDHLSWEEKIQRKKLKNRVAAQTSRDRKKAKMDQMESAIQELFSKNETLLEECASLRALNERLSTENAELQSRLNTTSTTASCQNCKQQSINTMKNRSGECESESGSAESLLRPRGTVTHSAAILQRFLDENHSNSRECKKRQLAMLKIVLACLLYRTSWTSSTVKMSTSRLSNSSRRASFRISPETWRLLLKMQIFKNQSLIKKKQHWWGRHQKSWNPLEVTA